MAGSVLESLPGPGAGFGPFSPLSLASGLGEGMLSVSELLFTAAERKPK